MLRKVITNLLWLLPMAFLTVFYFYPLGSILGISFGREEGGVIGALLDALARPSQRNVIGFTFWQATLSTLATVLIGLPAAWVVARFRFRGKALFRALSGIPFVLPTLVVAAAFHALLGPRGWINLALMEILGLEAAPIQFVHSFGAILLAHVFYNTTIVIRMVGDFWGRIDKRVEEAARSLGANAWQSFRYVTIPMLYPAISAAALLVFLFNFTSFGVILILGGPQFATMEVEIYFQTVGLFNLPVAASLALIQLVSTFALGFIYTRLAKRISRPIRLRAQESKSKVMLGSKRGILALSYLLILSMFFAAPLTALAGRSVSRLDSERRERVEVDRGFTLEYYKSLSEETRNDLFSSAPSQAIWSSLRYAGLAVGISLGVGLPAALALARRGRGTGFDLLDSILLLPLGTSAVTLGLGFIVALNRPPLDLRASPILLPLAHSLVALPIVVRSLLPALRSIQPQIRQAAATLGAKPIQVLRYIDLPLIGRALSVSAIFAFTISLGEFGATAMIARPDLPTVPMMIFRLLGQPGALHYGQAMALSSLLMLITAGGMLIIERLRIADVGEF